MRIILLAFALSGFNVSAIVPSVPRASATQNVPTWNLGPCGPGPVYTSGQRGIRPPKPGAWFKPEYPDAKGHIVQAGPIMFEAVIDPNGDVCAVRLVRDVKF